MDLPVIVLLDQVHFGTTQLGSFTVTPIGPYFRGTDRYVFWHNIQQFSGQATKSIDGGVTWVVQDELNEPVAPATLRGSLRLGDTAYIVGAISPLFDLYIRTFSLATDTWGPVSALGPTGAQVIGGMQWGQSGKIRVVYRVGFSLQQVDYNIATNSWGAPVQIAFTIGVNWETWCCMSDPSGTLHVLYGNPSPRTYNYVQVSPAGAVTVPVSIPFGQSTRFTWGAFLGTKLVIPGYWTTATPPFGEVAMLTIDPYTSPSPSTVLTDSGFEGEWALATSGNGKVYVFYSEQRPPGGDSWRSYYREYDGVSFGTAVSWHDNISDPLPGTGIVGYHNHMPPTVRPDGGLAWIFGMDYFSFCSSWYSENAAPGPSPPPPGPGQLGVCRTILHLFQHAVSPQVEITKDRKGDWTDCGTPSYKFFQGVKIDADTFAVAKSLQIRDSDTGALHLLQPAAITHSGRQILPYSFSAPFKAHTVRDEPQDMVPWRNFGLEYIWEPTPESVQTWKTQWTAHGFNGYMHICRIDAAWESTAAVTLTILSFDGMSPAVLTLPSTGGTEQKLLLTLTPNKGQAYQYTATSTGAFRLFLNDWIVWVGPWGRQGPYVAYRLLGGEIGDKAKI